LIKSFEKVKTLIFYKLSVFKVAVFRVLSKKTTVLLVNRVHKQSKIVSNHCIDPLLTAIRKMYMHKIVFFTYRLFMILISACNLSKNWVKVLFYDRFIAGTLKDYAVF